MSGGNSRICNSDDRREWSRSGGAAAWGGRAERGRLDWVLALS